MREHREYEGVSIVFEEHCVRVTTNKELFEYLERPGKRDADHLAEYIRTEYEGIFGKPLEISAASLSVEILIHAYIDRLAHALQSPKLPVPLRGALESAVERVEASTAVIDCGERCVDGNRFVFDGLAPFAPAIMALLEK